MPFVNPLYLLKLLLPRLAESERAKVVVISGISSVQALLNYALNNALRAAWLAQAKTLALALGEKNIHVNTLSLGGVMTAPYTAKLEVKAKQLGRSFAEQMSVEVENVPLGKYASVEEVAKVIEILLGEFTDHITGQNIVCDGGFVRAY